jgi:hypothetical protein
LPTQSGVFCGKGLPPYDLFFAYPIRNQVELRDRANHLEHWLDVDCGSDSDIEADL